MGYEREDGISRASDNNAGHKDEIRSTALREFEELIASLDPLLRPQFQSVLDSLEAERSRRNRILQLVQEGLGQLRLDMKYLLFDLEATRREREELKRRLDGDC